jgi:hypothetical protein
MACRALARQLRCWQLLGDALQQLHSLTVAALCRRRAGSMCYQCLK